jgi:His/Glu/Gln/Arg/opine family amino acid ABC transporter permease subunit
LPRPHRGALLPTPAPALLLALLVAVLLAPAPLAQAPPAAEANAPPLAVFFAVPSVAAPGQEVELNATDSRDPDGNITRYEWDLGTGTWAEGPAVLRHAFPQAGQVEVRLRVTDQLGASAETQGTVLVTTGQGPAFNVPVILRTLPFWAQGALVTLYLGIAAMLLALPLAVVLGLARASRKAWARWPAGAYVELIRGTPLLVQILIAWLVLPQVGLRLSPLDAGLLALTLNTAGYLAEVVRAGIQAIPQGQMDAALSLGFRPAGAMRHVVLPQAFRVVVPPLTNDFAVLLKDTSLVSVIGVVDLTQVTRIVSAQTFAVLELWLGVAVIYFALIWPITLLSRHLERRLHVPGLGGAA